MHMHVKSFLQATDMAKTAKEKKGVHTEEKKEGATPERSRAKMTINLAATISCF